MSQQMNTSKYKITIVNLVDRPIKNQYLCLLYSIFCIKI